MPNKKEEPRRIYVQGSVDKRSARLQPEKPTKSDPPNTSKKSEGENK